jgi:hypothetical protein
VSDHTKTPWRLGRPGSVVADYPVPEIKGSDDLKFYGGHLVAETVTPANAAHIVRAVNSHENLLVLCEVMVDMLEKADSRYVHPAFRRQWLERARASLALVKQETT